MSNVFGEIITYMDWVTIFFSFVTMIIVVTTYLRNIKQQDKIELCFLVDGKDEICIPTYLMRKHVTRAEVSGVLGFIQKNSKERHNIKYLASEQYLKDIYDIQLGNKNKLLIKAAKDELQQFEL